MSSVYTFLQSLVTLKSDRNDNTNEADRFASHNETAEVIKGLPTLSDPPSYTTLADKVNGFRTEPDKDKALSEALDFSTSRINELSDDKEALLEHIRSIEEKHADQC